MTKRVLTAKIADSDKGIKYGPMTLHEKYYSLQHLKLTICTKKKMHVNNYTKF